MLLNTLTPPDTVPTVSASDLRDVSDAKTEALNAWDARLGSIFSEHQNHPQQLRPLRMAMEERLLRAFAGLINQLRQEGLGIEQYIWRSQDDAKVRDSHAAYDDRVFRWNNSPEGGHPGEAHNCRCYAEPILQYESGRHLAWEPSLSMPLICRMDLSLSHPIQGLTDMTPPKSFYDFTLQFHQDLDAVHPGWADTPDGRNQIYEDFLQGYGDQAVRELVTYCEKLLA